MSKHIVLYTKSYCPYCHRAKALLSTKGVEFTEIEISENAELADEMVARSGRRTVPQIFIADRHIGGASDLFELDDKGGLDPLLAPFIARPPSALSVKTHFHRCAHTDVMQR